MIYRDLLYGEWELPPIIERLVHTKEMARLRNITQSTLPNSLLVEGPLPSRFHHGMGVAFLANLVIQNNPVLYNFKDLLPASALLHDAGNPPFSHLSEHFLKEITGKNGESFLENILNGSETASVLKDFDLSMSQVVRFVTGSHKPFSEVLHGSMDLDNLDNVGRHNFATNLGAPEFNAVTVASSFKFSNVRGWSLPLKCRHYAKEWQKCRFDVYNHIYNPPHLNIAMMVYRALQIAFIEGEISKDFFFLDDNSALLYLKACNKKSAYLARMASRWNWYDEVLSLEYENPSAKLKNLADGWKGRQYLADKISDKLNIPQEKVCTYIGKGKEKRKIEIPFVAADGGEVYDDFDDRPVYRIKIYVPKDLAPKLNDIKDVVLAEIN